jgi:serine/threonine protein kinase
MTLVAGARLGPFEILAPIGAGGMGEVYRARDTRLSRDVAIKVLPAAVSSNPERLRRFEKEARAASSLNHPNIVTVHDIGESGGTSFIAMERRAHYLLTNGIGPGWRLHRMSSSPTVPR